MHLTVMFVFKRGFYRYILIVGIIGFSGFKSCAQTGWEAGLWIGAGHYFGDLNTRYNLEKPGEAFGLMARYNFNNRVALKIAGNYGVISASDAYSKNPFEIDRNLSLLSGYGSFCSGRI